MKKPAFLLITVIILLLFIAATNSSDSGMKINPILGDKSYIEKFGVTPDQWTDENVRIKTHLQYVEHLLRNRQTRGLTPALHERREHALDLLHEYSEAGLFPRNYDVAGKRAPCFIDKDGRICAVGYLVAQTTGRQTAEDINQRYKYERIADMKSESLEEWIRSNGLTKEECAMIQPAYGYLPDPNRNDHISTTFGISSALASGINIPLSALNTIQCARGTTQKNVSILGLLCGGAQITLGMLNADDGTNRAGIPNESRKKLAFWNIGAGTATVFMSAANLISNRKTRSKGFAINLYNAPVSPQQVAYGITLTKKL